MPVSTQLRGTRLGQLNYKLSIVVIFIVSCAFLKIKKERKKVEKGDDSRSISCFVHTFASL